MTQEDMRHGSGIVYTHTARVVDTPDIRELFTAVYPLSDRVRFCGKRIPIGEKTTSGVNAPVYWWGGDYGDILLWKEEYLEDITPIEYTQPDPEDEDG